MPDYPYMSEGEKKLKWREQQLAENVSTANQPQDNKGSDEQAGELKKALKKDFNQLLVKEFTSDWSIQRLKIGLDIDVMSLDNLQALITSQAEAICEEILDTIGE